MSFTAQELANAANALLDYHVRGPAMAQTLQDRPLYRDLIAGQKTFPGGKEFITWPIKGQYTTGVQGYTHDDTVGYANPANIKRAQAKWYEVHAGISLTLTELKMSGISVTDSMTGKSTSSHSEKDMVVLTDLLQDKIDDMMEGYARSFAEMLWRDGTQDAKAVPGITSFLLDSPTAAGSTFGVDRTANTFWRNRATLSINAATPGDQNLVNTLQKEFRQLRRFGGKPNKFYAGSDFMDAFEKELRSKGNYTLEGWSKQGKIDASIADLAFKGTAIEYEPLLDDLGKQKFGYWMDMSKINLQVMDGEDRKIHTPARPPEKYVLFRAITTTAALTASQLNCHGVYSIA
jgi:hypothetical protein